MRIVCQNPNLVNSLSVMCCSSNTHLGTYLVLAYPTLGSPGGGWHTGGSMLYAHSASFFHYGYCPCLVTKN